MTGSERTRFEKELSRIVRRVNLLKAALDDSADIVTIKVAKHKVKEHERAAHVRYVFRKKR